MKQHEAQLNAVRNALVLECGQNLTPPLIESIIFGLGKTMESVSDEDAATDKAILDWLDKETQQKIHLIREEVAAQWQRKCDNYYQLDPSFRRAALAAKEKMP